MESLNITCPRCGHDAEVAFYGPCEACRKHLRTQIRGDQNAMAAVEYEPKLNVTPNAVALKDD